MDANELARKITNLADTDIDSKLAFEAFSYSRDREDWLNSEERQTQLKEFEAKVTQLITEYTKQYSQAIEDLEHELENQVELSNEY